MNSLVRFLESLYGLPGLDPPRSALRESYIISNDKVPPNSKEDCRTVFTHYIFKSLHPSNLICSVSFSKVTLNLVTTPGEVRLGRRRTVPGVTRKIFLPTGLRLCQTFLHPSSRVQMIHCGNFPLNRQHPETQVGKDPGRVREPLPSAHRTPRESLALLLCVQVTHKVVLGDKGW